MKNKFGFTLAEVLITLGIIGVVAALTAPALVKNSGQAKIGPALAKFVNTWETACEQMMHEEEINDLSSITEGLTVDSNLFGALSKHMIMTKLPDEIKYTYYAPDGTNPNVIDRDYYPIYQLKDGSIIFPGRYRVYNDKKGAYKGSLGRLLIDINGPDGNNRTGKEVFRFEVDGNGLLVPYGSNAHKYLDSSYIRTCSTSSNNVDDGFACTGAIADNGWKADY